MTANRPILRVMFHLINKGKRNQSCYIGLSSKISLYVVLLFIVLRQDILFIERPVVHVFAFRIQMH